METNITLTNCSIKPIEVNIVYKENKISMFLFLDFYDFISLKLAGSDPQIKLPGETNQNIEQAGNKVQYKFHVHQWQAQNTFEIWPSSDLN